MITVDLSKLANQTAQTAVSIYAPTHKTSPENENDRIVVKNIVGEALTEIEKLGAKRDFSEVIENLNAAFESIDWNYSSEGLAILASEEGFWTYNLNHSPSEQMAISDQFVITEIAKSLNKSWDYYLLVLSESPTRLFKGSRQDLTEIKGGFPLSHGGRGGSSAIPTAFGQQTSVILDEEHRKFFRKVSEELSKVTTVEPLPIIVTGVDRFISFWAEIAPEHAPVAQIQGSYDFMSDSELITVAWPEIQNYFRAENIKVTERLDIAFGNKTYAGGFDEVIEMAQLGRVAHLVVSDEVTSNPLTETAVRLTLQSGGDVSFVPAADLTKFAEICADLRF
jgi:hypothetical protein